MEHHHERKWHEWYCCWSRNPANQFRLVVYPGIHMGFLHPRWWSPDFWTINSSTSKYRKQTSQSPGQQWQNFRKRCPMKCVVVWDLKISTKTKVETSCPKSTVSLLENTAKCFVSLLGSALDWQKNQVCIPFLFLKLASSYKKLQLDLNCFVFLRICSI